MKPRIDDHHLDSGLLPSVYPELRTEAFLIEPVLQAIRSAVTEGDITAAQVFAGRIYTRKHQQCTTAFGRPANPGYESEDDDYYLQIGVRVPSHASKQVLDAIGTLEALSNEQMLREARARLAEAKERTAAAQNAEARIQTEVDHLVSTKE